MDIEELFTSWKLDADILEVFQQQQVTVEGLKHLSDEDFKELLPRMGPRNYIKMKVRALFSEETNNNIKDLSGGITLNEHQTNLLNQVVEGISEDANVEELGTPPPPPPVTPTATSYQPIVSTPTSESTSLGRVRPWRQRLQEFRFSPSAVPQSEAVVEANVRAASPTANVTSPSESHLTSRFTASPSGSTQPQTNSPSGSQLLRTPAQGSQPVWVRAPEVPQLKEFDLELVLKETPKGAIVLSTFQTHKQLYDSSRSLLAECIVANEMKGNFHARITGERAKFLAAKVVERFPTEVMATWYRTVVRSNGDGKTVKGRIITKYYNHRRVLLKAGIIESTPEDTDEEADEAGDPDDPECCLESLAWLKGKNVTPWTRVLNAWSATSKYRLRELQRSEVAGTETRKKGKQVKTKAKVNDAKVCDYIAQYPQILERQGWTLLELDFEIHHKDALLKLSAEYPKLEKFVLNKLSSNSDVLLDDEMSNDSKCARMFLALSKIFPVSTIAILKGRTKGQEGNQWRPSRQEVSDSFLLHIKAPGDFRQILEDRKNKLARFGLNNQPVAVIVGNSLDAIDNCYIVIDNNKYELETPLKAIDVVFKTYHALHACYPPESEQLWMFLQKAVYKFNTKWDRHFAKVDALVTEYKNFSI